MRARSGPGLDLDRTFWPGSAEVQVQVRHMVTRTSRSRSRSGKKALDRTWTGRWTVYKEALWLRLFLSLHSFPFPRPFPLLSDNQSACALANNSSITSRSKHIDIRHHFIRAHISDGTFCTNWIPTLDMPADIFTKPLPFPLFAKHRASLGLTLI